MVCFCGQKIKKFLKVNIVFPSLVRGLFLSLDIIIFMDSYDNDKAPGDGVGL